MNSSENSGFLNNVQEDLDETVKEVWKFCGVKLNIKEEDLVISSKNKVYGMLKFLEIIVAVFSSVLYAHYAAYRYDVDYGPDEDIDDVIALMPNNFQDIETTRNCNILQIVFESFFLIILISNFFVEYTCQVSHQTVRSLGKIANNYIFHGTFALDLLALIPWNFLLHFKGSRCLFLIKLYRLIISFELLDPMIIMQRVQALHQDEIEKLSKDPKTGDDILNDHTRIVKLIFMKHILEIVKIIT